MTVAWTGGVGGPRRRDALSRDPGNAVGSGPRVQSLTICQRSRYPRQLQSYKSCSCPDGIKNNFDSQAYLFI